MNCYREGFRLPPLRKQPTDTTYVWQPSMAFLSNPWSEMRVTWTHTHVHTLQKTWQALKGDRRARTPSFPLAERSWHVLDKLAKTTAELIRSFYFQRSSSYVNTLVKVAVVMKPEETGLPLAGPSVHKANRNVMEHWHSFHFELNTALPCVSRDNIKFCVWVIPGILQAGVEFYVAG